MRETELRKGTKFWCWWMSRFLWSTGKLVNGKFEFADICDEIILIDESQLCKLEAR